MSFPLPPRLGGALLALVVSGCALVGPEYRTPTVEVAATWQEALPHGGSTGELLDWWRSFDDSTLDLLQAEAVKAGPTLALAAARLDAARAEQDSATANGLPGANLKGNAQRIEDGQSTRQGLLDASWEIDLFGGLQRGREAAAAQVEARQAQWHEARVSLAAEVAGEYVRYRACRLLEQQQGDHLASLERTARTTTSAVQAGLSAPADGALADAGAAAARARLLSQQAECQLSVKSLVALTGLAEPTLRHHLDHGRQTLPQPAAVAVQSVPLHWLSQRPDLVAAERSVAAASAAIGQAQARRYPRLSLLGSISSDSRSSNWSFGPSLSLSLFDGGAGQAAVWSRQADHRASIATYRQTVRQAVREVEQALVQLDSASRREADIAASASGYHRHFAAAEQMWQVGAGSLLTLEQSRRDAQAAEQALITVRRDRLLHAIDLYKALGGGWQAAGSPSSLAESS
ncbi:efflux transporter outer membrane subunit [Chitinimonas lacunae]|uniref:Efflux transporter outer membrane subunit n=1 Tax=Chitinimonas lacunae TaxID=1963018 RepID=A0ABV8MPL0_9NEIS